MKKVKLSSSSIESPKSPGRIRHFLSFEIILCQLTSEYVCDQPNAIDKRLLELYENNAYAFYIQFQRYVPVSLIRQSSNAGTEFTNAGAQVFPSSLLPRFIPHWWNEDDRNLLHRSTGGVQGNTDQEYRFAVLGSGLDRNLSTNLFACLLNGRVGPFELLQIFPGRSGYGGGLSLRAHGYAQTNVLDSSMKPQEAYPPSCADEFQSDDGASPRVSTKRTHVHRYRRPKHTVTKMPHSSETINIPSMRVEMEDKNQPKDLIFDLVLLYADMNERPTGSKNELQRILTSRLYKRPLESMSMEQRVARLILRDELEPVLRTINGLIYAVDSEVPIDQLSHSRYELETILRSIGCRIPVVILYISSEHDKLDKKDSEKSIIVLIENLGLVKINHPWRLQKCMDDEILTILQSALWMRAHLSSGKRVGLTILPNSVITETTGMLL